MPFPEPWRLSRRRSDVSSLIELQVSCPGKARERKAPRAWAIDFDRHMWLSCNKASPRKRDFRDCCIMTSENAFREQGTAFMPKFDSAGLLTAVVTDSLSGAVLMVAFMDAEALAQTRATGLAHFHSRSRGRLWMKGESSGHVLQVRQILVDCDQDALVLKVQPAGPACHTGAATCFFRTLEGDHLALI